jgi:DNA-directed RNA polymerase delta subunit
MKKDEANDQIGEFYAEIMQDPRFIYCKNNN